MTKSRFQRVLITGATSGLGYSLARSLTASGAAVILHGRTEGAASAAAQSIVADFPDATISTVSADLGSRTGVRMLAQKIQSGHWTIDLLINNAGAAFPQYSLNEDGIERSVALNHHAPFLLTDLLQPSLSSSARVVNVSSAAARFIEINTERLDVIGTSLESDYSQLRAYGVSKLLNILATKSLARRHAQGRTVVLVDPGGIKTNLAEKAGDAAFLALTKQHWDDCVTADEAAEQLMKTAVRASLEAGVMYHNGQVHQEPTLAADATLADRVYEATMAAVAK